MSRATLIAFFTTFTAFANVHASTPTTTTTHVPRADARCSPGTYSASGNAPCYPCAAGSYSKESGVKSCTLARAGYYIPGAGATTEIACPAGLYSPSTGSTSCSQCPAGYQCPSSALANPQMCSPGRFSTGGNVVQCTVCPAGYFNNVQGATSCCACCAGFFNSQPGNTNCQQCSNQNPYSDPGSASCSSKRGLWAPSSSCNQPSPSSCPGSQPFPSAAVARRAVRPPRCLKPGQKACAQYSAAVGRTRSVLKGFECVSIDSDLWSCGGCVDRTNAGESAGRDCSAIPNIDSVQCESSKCVILSCRPGFVLAQDGEHCITAPPATTMSAPCLHFACDYGELGRRVSISASSHHP